MTGDLFGHDPPTAPKAGEVQIALVLHRESERGWLLSETARAADAQWAPKSEIRRGEGRDENVWTMPRWIAADRGWL